jgi:general secretion pathway protein G
MKNQPSTCSSAPSSAARLTRTQEKGFTLLEIIIVITIIGILLGWLTGALFSNLGQAKVGISEGKMKQAQQNIALYQLKNNRLPPDLRSAGVEDDKDGWGQPFQYQVVDGGRSYEIRSLGGDMRAGGAGADADIVVKGP